MTHKTDRTVDCVPRGIHLENLCKHMFVYGTPRGGKATALWDMLIEPFDRGGEHTAVCGGFTRCGHLATADELLGAFAMPVAGRGPLRFLRKNTEPAFAPLEDVPILEHDG